MGINPIQTTGLKGGGLLSKETTVLSGRGNESRVARDYSRYPLWSSQESCLHSTSQFAKSLSSQEADIGGRVALILPASQVKKQLLNIWPGP